MGYAWLTMPFPMVPEPPLCNVGLHISLDIKDILQNLLKAGSAFKVRGVDDNRNRNSAQLAYCRWGKLCLM